MRFGKCRSFTPELTDETDRIRVIATKVDQSCTVALDRVIVIGAVKGLDLRILLNDNGDINLSLSGIGHCSGEDAGITADDTKRKEVIKDDRLTKTRIFSFFSLSKSFLFVVDILNIFEQEGEKKRCQRIGLI